MTRPSILYIHSHDTGRHIQPYGYAAPTPNLQRLAESGVLFRQCFCAAPVCSASRAALLCGQSAHGSGMIGLAHRGFALSDYGRHLAATLRAGGYHAALAGAHHVATEQNSRDMLPYDEFLNYEPDGRRRKGGERDAAEFAGEFLDGRRGKDQPFFLAVGFGDTHRPFPTEFPPQVDPRYLRPPEPIPDTPETRADMAGFVTEAIRLDAKMGQVLDALDAAGLAENTLVICTTDHGIAFPRMKCNLTDAGIGVMLMMRGPGGFRGGKVCDAMVSHVDVFPTVCDVAGIEPPAWLEGGSMVPLVEGRAEQIREELFAEVTYHAAYEPQRCIRTRRYKYIRRYNNALERVVLGNVDPGPTKELWMRHGWADVPCPAECLYDLVFDPNEQNNLAARPDLKPVLDDLSARLDAWMRRTDDPLLDGPVPAPARATVTYQDCIHPADATYTLEKPEVADRKMP
jgi:N-sulfoglucosamine sulfohydrolase